MAETRTAARSSVALGAARVAVIVAGVALLALTFTVEYDDPRFYVFSALLAAAWAAGLAVERFLAAPRVERVPPMDAAGSVWVGAIVGLGLGAASIVGALVLRPVPVLGDAVLDVARPASGALLVPVLLTALVVGASEELMFRGAAFRWPTDRPLLVSTVAYVLVTLATMNAALIVAAAVLGFAWGVVRLRTGRVRAAVASHAAWTITTLTIVPLLVD